MKRTSRKRLALILAAVFVLSMIMGAGPGVLLVNTPQPWLGLPSLCTWGLFWYSIQAITAVAAYLFVWRDPQDGLAASDNTPSAANDTTA
jgi:hypothetical protein